LQTAAQGQDDEDALERALRSQATHVLMIASRRKAQRLREVMRMRGIAEERLERLAAPAGPDAGAKVPAEIALVAIVGVLAILRGRDRAAEAPAANPSPPPESKPEPRGAGFVNPVCGIAVDTAAPKHVLQFEGTAYYFCCDCCLAIFREDPAKYAAIHHASAARLAVG